MPIIIDNKKLLSQNDKSKIQSDVNFLLDNFNVKYPPVPILNVIKAAVPCSKIYNKETMPEGIKGLCVVGSGVCDIYINAEYSERPQRFTAGHELGHVLERESGCKGKDAFSEASKFKERRADYWAACFLMPDWMIHIYWKLLPTTNLSDNIRVLIRAEKLASIFEVSRQAMIIRLKHLKLIPSLIAEELLSYYYLDWS